MGDRHSRQFRKRNIGTETYGAVSLLGRAELLGEEDELSLVLLQTVDVGLENPHMKIMQNFINTNLESLLGLVGSPVIDSDSDGGSHLSGDTGLLQLLEGESTAEADTKVVTARGTMDHGSARAR